MATKTEIQDLINADITSNGVKSITGANLNNIMSLMSTDYIHSDDLTALKGEADGIAELDVTGKIPIEQIPSSALSILRRHDWTGTYDYIGFAPFGSTESESVWTITRMLISPSGSVTKGVATGSWTNRASLTYI
jgi:hypothetical protein